MQHRSSGGTAVDIGGEKLVLRLAEEQGVKPIRDIDELRGDFWPEDEDPDEFIETIRRWRTEGG